MLHFFNNLINKCGNYVGILKRGKLKEMNELFELHVYFHEI